jgi:hypothetical protein
MMIYQTRNWDNSNLSGKGPWVLADTYLITAADRPNSGYEVVERVPYFSWLSRSDRHLTILKRVE